jgi:hypothetical protein
MFRLLAGHRDRATVLPAGWLFLQGQPYVVHNTEYRTEYLVPSYRALPSLPTSVFGGLCEGEREHCAAFMISLHVWSNCVTYDGLDFVMRKKLRISHLSSHQLPLEKELNSLRGNT